MIGRKDHETSFTNLSPEMISRQQIDEIPIPFTKGVLLLAWTAKGEEILGLGGKKKKEKSSLLWAARRRGEEEGSATREKIRFYNLIQVFK